MTVQIRPLLESDHGDWRSLWTAYLAFYETTVSEKVHETAFARLLDPNPVEFQGLVAEYEGRVVGLAHFAFQRSLWTVEDTCYLMDLFTLPEWRGKGVARALIKSVNEVAQNAGVPSVYWLTQEFNYKGRMLYDTLAEKAPFIVYEMHD